MAVNLTIMGRPEFDAAMKAMALRVERGTGVATYTAANAIVKHIHDHMDGRPGPYRRTGNLFASVRATAIGGGVGIGRWNYLISSNTPYSRRIEYGFHGTDVLGRRYNQPPYPFFEPGVLDSIASGEISEIFYKGWSA